MQPFATWLTICCCAAAAVAQYNGGPVQFGPPPTAGRSQQPQQLRAQPAPQQLRAQPAPQQQNIPSSFQAPRFAAPVFAAPQNFRLASEEDEYRSPAPSRPAARPQQAAPSIPQYQTSYQPQAAKKASPPKGGRGSPSKNLAALAAELDEDEEEEEAKPDRLQELLPQSKFQCQAKTTGYYADEGLGCEVFHYCQDGARHSWVCPDGFTFHQVHLICMPPSHDNICAQSSKYFFVNEYLYQPVNAEEVARKPNTTLRYSDRYYPENEYVEEQQASRPAPKQQQQQPAQPQRRPAQPARPNNQVFHSPETVNIPLQQRRVPTPVQAAPVRQQSYDTEEYEYEDFPYRQQG